MSHEMNSFCYESLPHSSLGRCSQSVHDPTQWTCLPDHKGGVTLYIGVLKCVRVRTVHSVCRYGPEGRVMAEAMGFRYLI